MLNVRTPHRLCSAPNCDRRANFDHPGKRGEYCIIHKEEGMTQCLKRRCQFVQCMNAPLFDVRGGKGRFCVDHQDAITMVNVKKKKLCLHDGCVSSPSFGIKGRNARYCVEHKPQGSIALKKKRVCEFGDCLTFPCFDFPGSGEKVRGIVISQLSKNYQSIFLFYMNYRVAFVRNIDRRVW